MIQTKITPEYDDKAIKEYVLMHNLQNNLNFLYDAQIGKYVLKQYLNSNSKFSKETKARLELAIYIHMYRGQQIDRKHI